MAFGKGTEKFADFLKPFLEVMAYIFGLGIRWKVFSGGTLARNGLSIPNITPRNDCNFLTEYTVNDWEYC